MKRHAIALLIGAAAALASSGAWAQAGVVNITGSLRGTSCKINGSAASATLSLPVAMDALAVSALRTAGATTGPKAFSITLSDCDPATYSIHFDIASAAAVNLATGRLRNTSTGAAAATQVELEVLNKDFGPINIVTNAGNTQRGVVPTPATGATPVPAKFDFYVRYYATGTATAGTVTGLLPFGIQIN